jgi:hypothetical protein
VTKKIGEGILRESPEILPFPVGMIRIQKRHIREQTSRLTKHAMDLLHRLPGSWHVLKHGPADGAVAAVAPEREPLHIPYNGGFIGGRYVKAEVAPPECLLQFRHVRVLELAASAQVQDKRTS